MPMKVVVALRFVGVAIALNDLVPIARPLASGVRLPPLPALKAVHPLAQTLALGMVRLLAALNGAFGMMILKILRLPVMRVEPLALAVAHPLPLLALSGLAPPTIARLVELHSSLLPTM
jgi:hypothetical protein